MRAVLLVNMGGPADETKVRPYLRAIFRDPAILPVPALIRPLLSRLIVVLRANRVIERYRMIGGASPLIAWTERLCIAVADALKEYEPAPPVAYAFRYSEPTIETALTKLKTQRIQTVSLVPLFPHHTRAMTGSIETEAREVSRKLGMTVDVLPAWGNQADILDVWSGYLNEALAMLGKDARVLFVAHGIPLRDVRRGDDYPDRVRDTARALASSLPQGTEWTVAFQSKVGPLPWTRPYLKVELDRLCAESKPLVIMPISFAADCLETMYDLDLQAVPRARQACSDQVVRVRAFNDEARFARILARLAVER
ncbi:ferrochelatase [bacterium]|nr:ferrochelatase [bacterium]MBU1983370.1 ferrochelatase [bacterium]